jgi:tetratricopeptide (TPR) repeat protein
MRHGLLITLLTIAPAMVVAQEHEHGGMAGEKLGTVHFANTCSPAAQPAFTRGVALLHSFEFSRAIDAFEQALGADGSCGITVWGIAVCRWGNPMSQGLKSAAQIERGQQAIDRARKIGAKSARERDFIEAASKLYADAATVPQGTRLGAYRDAMGEVAARYPDDEEASIFYALSLAAAASPTDKTYADQLKAGAILEPLFKQHPDHPGLAHYIIHTYDAPPLASRALDAARRYAAIAPAAPHALHMPSHTFTRVGAWQESIDTNIASAAAARRDKSTGEELHAMDYQTYAYLQTAQDAAARRLVDALPEVTARFDINAPGSAAPPQAGLFATAALPARYALERRTWKEAAALVPQASPFPYTQAVTHFARALGASQTGDLAAAKTSIAALQTLHDQLVEKKETYWAGQVDIERLGATAWVALAEGRKTDALDTMRQAATQEDATEKSPVTPGPLAPARELLGDMLLLVDRPADALVEYEATLKKEPKRFRALYGAARAANLANLPDKAKGYYQQLVEMCVKADANGRPELAEAKKALGS